MSHPPSHGYHGRILEVDLSKSQIKIRPLDLMTVENYLGGRGLATRILYDEIDPWCEPLGADNVIVIAASPLIGTRAPTACRGHLVFKSPLSGLIGTSNCGGSWANFFKSAGFDVLLIKGKAAQPVFLDISPDETKIEAANHLWGLDVLQTTEILSAESKLGSRPRILCIGPAAENLVLISSLMNENRAFGRSGIGAVFGSKNLKAVRVSGKEKIEIQDAERFKSGMEQALYLMKAAPITKRLLRELGTSGLLKLIDVMDMLPHRNFQDNIHKPEDLDKTSGETLRKKILERPAGCFGCPIACGRLTRVADKKGEGPEYETIVMTGLDCDIYDLESIAQANYRMNELGIDTISFGSTLACAMELFERGYINKKDTEGIDLSFGNVFAMREMVEASAFRKGIGEKLAQGSFRLASFFKHPEYSMTVKKLEIPAYDPRASYTQALGYMTSPSGACHLRGGYAVSLAFFGGTKEIPRFSLLQSPIAIKNMQNLGIIQDSLGICRFTGFAFSTDPWSRMVSATTGLDFSAARLEKIANRVATLERIFNLEAGLNPEDDTLPERFSTEPILVKGKERLIPKEAMERMRRDYYQARGWDEKGKPTESLVKALEIEGRKK